MLIGVACLAFCLWLLFHDPSVKSESGAGSKIKAVAKGVGNAVTDDKVVPFSQDAIGWFLGKPAPKKGARK